MIPDYRLTRWQGRPCAICKVCGQTSGSLASERLADLWRREHTARCGRDAVSRSLGEAQDAAQPPARIARPAHERPAERAHGLPALRRDGGEQ